MRPEKFEITNDHKKLLARMYVGWQDCEFGAPEVDPKRPYGNSDVEWDVAEILGWIRDDRYDLEESMSPEKFDEFSDAIHDRAMTIHQQMETVVQAALQYAAEHMPVGEYETSGDYNIDWRFTR